MAVKHSSPHAGRAPSVLPIVDVKDSSTTLIVDSDKIPRWIPKLRERRSNKNGRKGIGSLLNKTPLDLVVAILTWYLVGVGSICTTKILLMDEYALPPLVLTFQQLVLGSSLLHLHLWITGGLQPFPEGNTKSHPQQHSIYFDFVLMGLFNALDFLASNTCFSHSAASFVETIKASEPLTTTAIALFFGIDSLRTPEAMSIAVLILGVYFSTMGNADHRGGSSDSNSTPAEEELSFHQSVRTCVIVITANICFALRAKSQKVFQAQPEGKAITDANLLMRMQQIGAASLVVPFILIELPGVVQRTMDTSWHAQGHFWCLAIANAACFCTYCVASCYVLSKLSVVQHTGLGCLRRMFAILFTSFAFGVPITPLGGLGIVLCFCGFCSFTHFRYKTPTNPQQQSVVTPASTPLIKSRHATNGPRSHDV
jgi:drug/metabolite transporter (DMT)-like permease